ncbi:type-F conjugative transfer system pilin assembly protein TraF [Shewanella psychropiezotolerans]|uniref:Type-F conjugative transfer system pilin assembly protein TraF n=1 Tax=Shewanella psychropiezotolerans TaxID=2593655 RepID=A0ABX5WTL1_9GAMM|nr:type-F conjugative transfer system pilin assembly protein TraF [Shewanella psychropiezotolerans]QDO82434.1 type-F conjugative transfer system pilin assembly protein TraF [Shewanella psychropiezotolerans]
MSVGLFTLSLAHYRACQACAVRGLTYSFMVVAAAVVIAVVMAVVMVMLSSLTRAAYASEAAGWRWYNEPKTVITPPKQQERTAPSVTVTRTLSPTEQLRSFKRYFDDTLNDAVINPTNANKVEKSMRLNQYVAEQSSLYGMTFKKVLLANPALSYTKNHPTEQAARRPYLLLQRSQKVRAVRRLAQAGWGLFFVYKGREAIDKALAPSVQQFADQHGIDLLGVTLDGQALDSIHHTRQNQQHLTVPFSPALVLVNPGTGEMKPLAYGFISQADLLGRFLNVATDFAPDF